MGGRAVARALASLAVVMLLAAPVLAGNHQASGSGSGRNKPFAEVVVSDGSIAPFALTPTTSDPGPRAFSTADTFAFTNGNTNVRSVLSLEVTSAANGASSSTVTAQGTTHALADWLFAAQDSNTVFGTVRGGGVFDSNAAAYTAPGGFTKSSQGTVALRTYATPGPPDNGALATVNWIYDAGANKYMFDPTDKDFTNGNGEAVVWPTSKTAKADYTFAVGGNSYAVVSVASAGSNHVPTAHMGWRVDWNNAGPVTKQAAVLLDAPSGVPKDSYSYTLTATITKTK